MSNWLDLSNVSNILRQTYVNGFLDASGPIIARDDVSFNQKLFVSEDVSLNSRLFVGLDASFNNNVFVQNYVFSSTPVPSDNSNKLATTKYVQDKLSVLSSSASFVGDVTLFNRLFAYGDASMGGNFFALQNTILGGDVSMNTRLYVGGDVSMQRRLFVSGDVSLNGNVSVPTQLAADNSTKVATTQYVTTALSAFSGAYATFRGDVSINNRLFVGSDVSFGGNLFTNGNITSKNFYGNTFGFSSVFYNTTTSTVTPTSANATSTNWTAGGFSWTSLASTGTSGVRGSFVAFNGNSATEDRWSSDDPASYNITSPYAYKNTTYSTVIVGVNSGNPVYGEWLQISTTTSAITMSSFYFYPYSNANDIPGIYYICGSTNGSTWYPIAYFNLSSYTSPNVITIPTTTGSGTAGTVTYTTYGYQNTAYNYFRMVITNLLPGSNGWATFSEWNITFSKQNITTVPTNALIYLDASRTNMLDVSSNFSVTGDVSLNTRLFVGSDASFGGNVFVKSAINLLNNSTIIGTTYVPNSVNATSNSWTANGVNWTTSASSFFSGLPPYRAFNLEYAGGGWAASSPNYTQTTNTSSYSTTIVGIGSIQGEWLQIQSSVAAPMLSYQFAPTPPTSLPKTYYIVGSTDGSTWYPIQYGSTAGLPVESGTTLITPPIIVNSASTQTTGSSTVTTTTYSTTTNSYTYFRLIPTTNFNVTSGYVILGQWYITFGTATIINNSNTSISLNNTTANQIDISGALRISGDTLLTSRFFVNADSSLNGNLFVNQRTIQRGDLSANSRLYLGSDLSMGGNLFVAQRTIQVGDLSANSRLFLSSDASFGGRLYVVGDVSLNGNVSVPTQLAADNSTKVATTQYVTTALGAFSGAYATFRGDVSINNRLFVGSDVSFGGKLFSAGDVTFNSRLSLNSDASMNGNLSVGNNIIGPNVVATNSLLIGPVVVPTVLTPNTTTIASSTWTNSGITWIGSYSASTFNITSIFSSNILTNGGAGWYSGGNQYTTSYTSPTGTSYRYGLTTVSTVVQNSLGTIYGSWLQIQSSTALTISNWAIGGGEYWGGATPQSFIICGSSNGSTWFPLINCDWNSNPLLASKATAYYTIPGGTATNATSGALTYSTYGNGTNAYNYFRMIVTSVAVVNNGNYTGAVSTQWFLNFVQATSALTGIVINYGDISLNNRLFVGSDVSLGGNFFVSQKTIKGGDISANSRLFVGSDSSFGGNLFVNSRTIQGGDLSANSRLFLSSDASFGGKLFVAGDVSLNGSVSVPTPLSTDNSTKVATTAYVKTALVALTGASATFSGDVSINNRLYVGSDVSFGGNLFTNGNITSKNFYGNTFTMATSTSVQVTPNTSTTSTPSWTFNGINWSWTASSASFNELTFCSPFNDNITNAGGNYYDSGAFYNSSGIPNGSFATTTVNSIGTVNGEYIQLRSSIPLVMSSYQIANGDVLMRAAKTFYIVGSNDGTTWYPIQFFSVPANPYTNRFQYLTNNPTIIVNNQYAASSYGATTLTTTTYGANTTNSYTYFRMIITSIFSTDSYFSIAEWNIQFSITTNNSAQLFLDSTKSNTLDVSSNFAVTGDVSLNSRLFIASDVSLGSRLFVTSDTSLNGSLFVNSRTIQGGDLSANSRFYLGSDLSMGGNLYVGQRSIQNGDVSMNARLYVGSDVSLGGNLYISKDLMVNGNLAVRQYNVRQTITTVSYQLMVAEDLSVNGRLFLSNDASINGRLYVGQDASLGSRVFVNGDVSLNSCLFVGSDASFGGNLYVKNNMYFSMNQIISSTVTPNTTAMTSTATTWTNNNITWTASESSRFASTEVGSQAFNNMYTTSGTGNNSPWLTTSLYNSSTGLYTGSASTTVDGTAISGEYITLQSSSAVSLANFFLTTRYYPSAPPYNNGCAIPRWFHIAGSNNGTTWTSIMDCSFYAAPVSNASTITTYSQSTSVINVTTNTSLTQQNSNVNIYGYSGAASSYTYFRFIVRTIMGATLGYPNPLNDGRANFFLNVVFNLTTTSSLSTTSSIGLNGTTSNQIDISGALKITRGLAILGDISANSRLYVGSDVSFGGNLFVNSRTVQIGDLSANSRLYVGSDASFGGNLFVNSRTIQNGDASMNNRLFVAADVSFGSRLFVVSDISTNRRLFVGQDTSLNGSLFVNSRTIQNGDISANSRLFLSSDASFGGRLFIAGDVSLNGNVNVNGLLTAPTPLSTDNSTKVATTAYVKTALTSLTGASATFNGDVSVNFRLYVASDASLQGRLFVSNDASFNGKLSVAGNVSINGTTNLSGAFNVSGDVSFNGNIVGQNIKTSLALNVNAVNNATFGTVWTLNSRASTTVGSVAMSRFSGNAIAIANVSSTTYILWSTDYGVTWTNNYNLTALNANTGGNTCGIAISDTGQYAVVFAAAVISTVQYSGFVTSNFGSTWTTMPNINGGSQMDNATISANGQNIITHTSSVGFYSTNGGVSFTQTTGSSAGVQLAGSSSGQYCISTNGRRGYLNYTTNYGANWTETSTALPTVTSCSDVAGAAMSSSGNYAYVVCMDGYGNNGAVMVSTNYGATWAFANGGVKIGGYAFLNLKCDATGQYIIALPNNNNYYSGWYSTNYGATIKSFSSTFFSSTWVRSFAISGDGFYAIGTVQGTGALYNQNNSTTILGPDKTTIVGTFLTNGDASMNNRLFVSADASFGSRLFVVSDTSINQRLFVGSDVSLGGNLFVNSRTVQNGDASMNNRLFIAADVSLGSRLFVVSDTSINRRLFVGADSSFGGNFFVAGRTVKVGDISANARLFVGSDSSLNGNVYIDKDLTVNGNLYVKAYTTRQMITELSYQLIVAQDISVNGRLFLSNDASINGRLFVGADVSFGSRLYVAGDVSFGGNIYSQNIVTALSTPFIINSANYAQSWAQLSPVPAGQNLSAVAISSTGQYAIVGGYYTGVGIYYTSNYGQSWTQSSVSTALQFRRLAMSGSGQYAVGSPNGSGNVYYSSDYGQTWSAVSLSLGGPADSSVTMSFSGSNVLFGGNGIRYSSNYGVTFTQSNITTSGTYCVAISGVGTYAAAAGPGGTYYSSNSGQTWSVIPSMSVLSQMAMSNNGQYVLALDGANFWYSSNYGVTYTISSSGSGTTIACSSTGQYGVAASFNSTLYYTTNYGVTWASTNVYGRGYLYGTAISSNAQYTFVTSAQSDGGPLFNAFITTNSGTGPTNSTTTFLSSIIGTFDASINNRLFLGAGASIGGNLLVSSTTIQNGDVSMNRRLFIGSDVSVGGNLFVNSRTIQNGDLSANNRLFVGADVSFGSRLFVISDTSINQRLFVGADVSFGSRLFVVSDISTNQRLFVGQDTSLNGNLFISKLTVQGGDLSANSRLFLLNDASLGGRLFVRGDVSLNGNVFATTQTTGDNTTRVATTAFVTNAVSAISGASASFGGDVSVNFRLYVGADASLNGRLFVNNDASFNRRLYVGADVSLGGNLSVANVFKPTVISEPFLTSSDTTSSYTFNYAQGSIFYITAPPSSNFTVNFANVPTDISRTYLATLILSSTVNKTFCTSVQINGNTAISPTFANGQPLASTLGSMNTQSIIIQRISPGDVSSNMNVFTSITPYLTGTGNNLLVAYGDSSFNGRLFLSSDASFQGNFYAAQTSVFGGDASLNQRLFVGGDVSMSGRLFTVGDTSLNARLYVGSDSSFGSNLYVARRTVFGGDLSANARLYLGSDASLSGRLYVVGDVSLNGNVFVTTQSQSDNSTKVATTAFVKTAVGALTGASATFTGDVSINYRLYVGADASINANLYITKTTIANGDVSLNQRLFIGADSSLNGNLFVSTVFKTTNIPAITRFDFSNNFGVTWTQRASSLGWTSISSSESGEYQAACVTTGFIFVSADYGVNWTQYASSRAWTSIAVSQSGQYMTASVQTGYIFTSSNYGQTWTQQNSSSVRNWSSVAVSSTGQYQAATDNGGYIYTSPDYGVTWNQQGISIGSTIWGYIAISGNGQYLVTGVQAGGYLYVSSDFGVTWTAKVNDTNRNWYAVGISSNGQYQTACVYDGRIYTSSNYGSTWTLNGSAPSAKWTTELGISTTGQYQVAAVNPGYAYVSSDYGATWTQVIGSGSRNWNAVTMSQNGVYLSGCVSSGFLYVSTTPTIILSPAFSTFNALSDVSLNQRLYLGSDASINGNVSTKNISVSGIVFQF